MNGFASLGNPALLAHEAFHLMPGIGDLQIRSAWNMQTDGIPPNMNDITDRIKDACDF